MLNSQAPLAVADSEREVSYDTKTNKDINYQTMRHHTNPPSTMAPQVVGNLMTFSYLLGLTLGSLLSYWLDSLLGPPGSPCTGQEAQWTSRPGQHRCGPCFTPLY